MATSRGAGHAGTRTGGAQRFLADVLTDQVAWLLKLIWHSGTLALADHCLRGASPILLDPRTDRESIANVAEAILANITAAEHGIAVPSHPVDPSEYGASHLAMFAVNAVTKVLALPQGPTYQLEDYYPHLCERATRPYQFSSRGEYLRRLREAKPIRL